MIIKLLLGPFWIFIEFLMGLLPDTATNIPSWYSSFSALLKIALSIFPADVWAICIANISFWLSVQLVWAIIEWIYKKIPGVD